MRETRGKSIKSILMKRVLIIVPTDSPGGAERILTGVASVLGNKLTVSVDYLVLGRQLTPSMSRDYLPSRVNVRYGTFSSPWMGIIPAMGWLTFRRYDLVVTSHIHTNALVGLLRRAGFLRVRRAVARESTVLFDRFGGMKAALAKGLYRLYEQDLVIAQTGYMAEHVQPHLSPTMRRRILTMPNPVDVARIEAAAAEPLLHKIALSLENGVNVLVCGRLIDVKQPALAVETFRRLRGNLPAELLPRLVFLGDGPLRGETEAAVRAAGLDADVVFLGQQSNPYAIMRACHYGLLTSLREGFPNVVLEMMACGLLKIVMTPCAGDLDTLPGVHVTADFQAETLAAALADAIRSGEDQSAVYRQAAAARSVDRYLDVILGETPA